MNNTKYIKWLAPPPYLVFMVLFMYGFAVIVSWFITGIHKFIGLHRWVK